MLVRDVSRYLMVSGLAGALITCSDESSSMMTAPATRPAPPSVSNAQVLVGGQAIEGAVVEGTGESALFRVRIHAPGGLGTIQRVVLRYSQPGPNHHGGPMMGGFRGTVLCYDDGTHGDDVPGDGIYHFMDPDDAIGCHGFEAPPGPYHYEFWCEDVFGQQSNVASVTINRE
ncbi:MAG TPA: hypothetical protein VLK65_05855 [Vicinamibacteria bacterium]|nr:hypothetical protein [Vicinamibacteria bacterium]